MGGFLEDEEVDPADEEFFQEQADFEQYAWLVAVGTAGVGERLVGSLSCRSAWHVAVGTAGVVLEDEEVDPAEEEFFLEQADFEL
uniref:Uncharacterized protein n=1 Tax=Oryza sativa subsp. indica TaxID=39946 RepID=A0A679B8R6_ORYSI|nr:hypothetical protein [Oryza sativa Indica Group]